MKSLILTEDLHPLQQQYFDTNFLKNEYKTRKNRHQYMITFFFKYLIPFCNIIKIITGTDTTLILGRMHRYYTLIF